MCRTFVVSTGIASGRVTLVIDRRDNDDKPPVAVLHQHSSCPEEDGSSSDGYPA